jgi:hypothetical protein
MEIIYRTIDGKEFDNEADACFHESMLRDSLKMWNRRGNETEETSQAFCVYIANEEASKLFVHLTKVQGDQDANGICDGDHGLFYWDECEATYRYVDEDERLAIVRAHQYITRKEV